MKEQGQARGHTASEQYIGQPQARTIADLEHQLAEAQGKLDDVAEAIDDNSTAASGVRHERQGNYMNNPTEADYDVCRPDCPRCRINRILSKEGNE